MRKAELIVTVTLTSTPQGGREGPTPPEWFGCVVRTEKGDFGARLHLDGPISPGETRTAEMHLLSPKLALPALRRGMQFSVWEGRVVGVGFVDDVLDVKVPA